MAPDPNVAGVRGRPNAPTWPQHIVPDRTPSKAALIVHLSEDHPELVHPDAAGLRRWRKDELLSTHAEMHREPKS